MHALASTPGRRRWVKHLIVLSLFVAVPACSRITCSQKRRRAIEFMNLGVKAYQDGLAVRAQRQLKRAVREDDSYVTAHYNLAKVYQDLKKWEPASRQLVRVTSMEPKNARALYDLGTCYQNLKRYDLSRDAYNKALGIQPKLYVAHYRLGTIAETQDKPKEADGHYRKAIQINARFVKPFVKLGLLYLNYDYPDLAMQVMKSAVAINKDSGEAYNALGAAYQLLKQYDKAAAAFKVALENQPGLYDAMYNRGMALAAAGKTKEAEKALRVFIRAARGKKSVDQEFIHAAQDKISEMYGQEHGPDSVKPTALPNKKGGASALPKKPH